MMAIGDAYVGGYIERASLKGPPSYEVADSCGTLTREGQDGWGWFTVNEHQKGALDLATGKKRHQGRLNVLFCDGHVEGLKVQEMFFGKRDQDLRLWNADNQPHRERLNFSK